jgi:alpha-beta hydrolase superfamily lysophospholipase
MVREFADWFKVLGLVLAYAAVTLLMAARSEAEELRAGPFQTFQVDYGHETLREGTYAQVGDLRGCVVYLEGLGDSILNHEPLFRALARAGYRTLSFDYFGQGGSSGSMSDTRVEDAKKPFVEIGNQARFVWNRHNECAASKKFVIGWSTGGLAAYKLAVEKWADAVVLLAPGLYPKTFVGEAAGNSSLLWKIVSLRDGWPQFYPVISLRSLTRDLNRSGAHVDGVKPSSPVAVLPFAKNLIFTSMIYRSQKTDVPGLALLSGDEDTYVDRAKSEAFFKKLPRFQVVSYPGALHELDNEIEPVRLDVQKRTIEFFNSIR